MSKELFSTQKLLLVFFSISLFFISGELIARVLKYGEKDAKEDIFFDYPLSYNFFRRKTLPDGQRVLFGYREGVDKREFPEKKAKDIYRIFCLGDSTVRGGLISELSFYKFLNVMLNDILKEKKIEVLTAGVGGFDSSRTLEMLLEILNYSPDLVIVYSSNNEYYHQNIPPGDTWILGLERLLSRSRFYFFLKRNIVFIRKKLMNGNFRPIRLTPYNLERKYERNLNEMIRRAINRNVKVILCTIPTNLKDQPPLKSEFYEDLDEETRRKRDYFLNKGIEFVRKRNYLLALSLLKKSVSLDSNNAMDYYYMAKACEGLKKYREAKVNYQMACDLDGNKQRVWSTLNQIVRDTSIKHKVPLVDLILAFEGESTNGLVGDNLIIDPVHPLPTGHWLIAKEICNVLYKNEFIAPKSKWRWDSMRTKEEYEDLLVSFSSYNRALSCAYFYTGIAYSNENWNCPERAIFCFKKAISMYEGIIEEELNSPRKYNRREWWRVNPQVFINIGRAFLERNKFYKALIYVNKAIEIDKGFKEAYTFREDLLSTYAHNFKSDR